MNCPECHELLQQRLDGGPLADRAALEHHLAQCSECRECHSAAQRLADGLRLLAAPALPEGFAGRIVTRVLADHRARRAWRLRIYTAAAVAAALLLMTFIGYQRLEWFGPAKDVADSDKPRVHHAKIPPGKGQRPSPGVPAPTSLDQTLAEAGSMALALTRRTAGETMAKARQLLPPANPLPVPLAERPSLAPVLGPPAQSLRLAGHNVSDGLQPVTSSARRAFDLFLREMPALNFDKPSGS